MKTDIFCTQGLLLAHWLCGCMQGTSMRINLYDSLPGEIQMAENLASRFITTHFQHKYDGHPLLQLRLWGGNRVLLLLLQRQGPGTRGHSPGSPCQAAPDCLPGVSANKGCRKTQSLFLMWFGKGSQVQPEESLAEKVQFCISSFI